MRYCIPLHQHLADRPALRRAAYLKYWATAFDPKLIPYWDVRDELITIVATSRWWLDQQAIAAARTGGDRHDHVHRHLSVRERRWKCIQAQISVAPEHYPPMTPSSASMSRQLQPRRAKALIAPTLTDGRRYDAPLSSRVTVRKHAKLYLPRTCALASHIALADAGADYSTSGSTSRPTSRTARNISRSTRRAVRRW